LPVSYLWVSLLLHSVDACDSQLRAARITLAGRIQSAAGRPPFPLARASRAMFRISDAVDHHDGEVAPGAES
jgi:hypothetical protein